MSKIYKATIYISDINGICEDIEDIKQQIQLEMIILGTLLMNIKEP